MCLVGYIQSQEENSIMANATATQDKAKDEKVQEETESKREAAAKAKAEAEAKARQAAIDAGDLVVTKTHEFTATTKETKASTQTQKIVDTYRKSDKPLIFAEVAEKAGSKYPEDLL